MSAYPDTQTVFKNIVLKKLSEVEKIENSETLEQEFDIPHDKLESILKSLVVDAYIELDPIKRKEIRLTEKGEECLGILFSFPNLLKLIC